MVWLFQQIWVWVLISAVFGFAVTLAAVLERESVTELTKPPRPRAGRHAAKSTSPKSPAPPAAVTVHDVDVEPFDPTVD